MRRGLPARATPCQNWMASSSRQFSWTSPASSSRMDSRMRQSPCNGPCASCNAGRQNRSASKAAPCESRSKARPFPSLSSGLAKTGESPPCKPSNGEGLAGARAAPGAPLLGGFPNRNSSRLPNCGGTAPARALPSRVRTRSAASLPSDPGMGPLSRLRRRCRDRSWDRLPSWGGMAPVRTLPLSANSCKLANSPRLDGMGPASALRCRRRETSCSRPPNSDGMAPFSPRRERSSATTRAGAPPRVTPRQKATGAARRQFSWKALPARTSRAASKRWQSRSRPGPIRASVLQNGPAPKS